MLGRNTIFYALILLLQTIEARRDPRNNTSCRLSSESPSPEVTPWSSKAIKVSWDKVFISCEKQDIKNLEVKVETQMNSVIEYRAKVVEIQENEVILDRSPCIKHKVYLVLNFTKNKKESLKSNATEYNKPLTGQSGKPWYGYAGPDLYTGLLTTEVVRHICLNKDLLSVTIPFIPDSLKDCMGTKMGDIQSLHTGGNKNPVGSDVKVSFMVKDPRGEKPHVLVESEVINIQACIECEMNNTSLPKAKAHNSSHIIVSWADVYQGCKHYEVRDVTIMVDGQRKKYGFMVKNRMISESACSNHSITIELNFKSTEKELLTSAMIQRWNLSVPSVPAAV